MSSGFGAKAYSKSARSIPCDSDGTMFCSASSAEPGGSTSACATFSVLPSETTATWIRLSSAARNCVSVPPPDCPQQPIRSGSASARLRRQSIPRMPSHTRNKPKLAPKAASGIFMLARSATADRRLAGAAAWVLNALPLPEWVVREDHVTFARQIREQLLVARPRLAVRGVAEWRENRRVAARTFGQIEVCGDVESRPAFERQLLDAITGSLDHAHDAWIERSPRAAFSVPSATPAAPERRSGVAGRLEQPQAAATTTDAVAPRTSRRVYFI